MEPAVELAGRVVAEQVVRRQVGDDLLKAAGEVVVVHHREAVGRLGDRPQRGCPLTEHRCVDRERQRLVDRRVEHRQAAWIDRIERRVRAVGQVEQLAERQIVVDLRQVHPIHAAGKLRRAARRLRIPRGQASIPRVDEHLGLPWNALAGQHSIEARIGPEQAPAVADCDDRLSLFTDAPQHLHEIDERIDRPLFVPPRDHLRGDSVLVGALSGRRRITDLVPLVLDVDRVEPIAFAPRPVPREHAFDGRRFPREGDVVGRHLGGHEPDQIVGTDHLVQRIDERAADVVRAGHVDVVRVEEDDEQPRTRALRHRARFGDRVRLDARLLRSGRADDDALELFDPLRLPALEDLEIVLRQVGDRCAVLRGEDVDAHVVRLRPKRGRLRRGRLCDGDRAEHRDDGKRERLHRRLLQSARRWRRQSTPDRARAAPRCARASSRSGGPDPRGATRPFRSARRCGR